MALFPCNVGSGGTPTITLIDQQSSNNSYTCSLNEILDINSVYLACAGYGGNGSASLTASNATVISSGNATWTRAIVFKPTSTSVTITAQGSGSPYVGTAILLYKIG